MLLDERAVVGYRPLGGWLNRRGGAASRSMGVGLIPSNDALQATSGVANITNECECIPYGM